MLVVVYQLFILDNEKSVGFDTVAVLSCFINLSIFLVAI